MGPNTVLFQTYKPVEIGDKATKQFQADLKKAGLTGVPDYGDYTGYITCDLAVTALEQAGKTPTRKGFVDGFRNLGTYDQAGLACQPVQVGLDSYGKYPDNGCIYTVTREEREVRGGEQGQAGLRQAGRLARRARRRTPPATPTSSPPRPRHPRRKARSSESEGPSGSSVPGRTLRDVAERDVLVVRSAPGACRGPAR